MAQLKLWIAGARLMTLPLSLIAVVLGIACAVPIAGSNVSGGLALLCLAVAFFLQIGVNFANDYSDGIRGTDDKKVRRGPVRLVGSGLIAPKKVLAAAGIFFGLAAIAGLAITIITQQWWLLAVGAVSIAAAWFYTGGKKPYGYAPFGELAVFLFFGLVPVVMTTYVLTGTVSLEAWFAGAIAGFLAAAVLLTNNLRDREKDMLNGKKTLSVVIGDRSSRVLYGALMIVPYILLSYFATQSPIALLLYAALFIVTIPTITNLLESTTTEHLVGSLKQTLLTAVIFELSLAVAITYF